jgi:hypothetical protein
MNLIALQTHEVINQVALYYTRHQTHTSNAVLIFRAEDRGTMFLQNTGIDLQIHKALQLKTLAPTFHRRGNLRPHTHA